MELKDLILLDEKEAGIAIKKAEHGELKIYIQDTSSNGSIYLMQPGHLEAIRRTAPNRTEIFISKNQFIRGGISDLRILKSAYEAIFDNSTKHKKNINETERGSLYKMILGMAVKKYKYNPNANRNCATGGNGGGIKADLDIYGLPLDEETIRNHLKEAYEMHKNPKLSITE